MVLLYGAVAGALIVSPWPTAAQESPGNPFEFFAPATVISDADRRRLDHDEVVVRTLQGGDGQFAVLVATRLNAPPEALATWTRAIAQLKRSSFVLAIGRFSEPPALSDLDGLRLDDEDLESIRHCLPGDCDLKLSGPEIRTLRAAVSPAGAEWREALQSQFKRMLVARVTAYRASGPAAVPPLADRDPPRTLEQSLNAILDKSPYLQRLPAVVAWLRGRPHPDGRAIESFFYWSKEQYGTGKPVISITHVGIVGPDSTPRRPAMLVAGSQIFATHYTEGAVGLTMVMRDATGAASYLVYLNRSELDLLRGFFGGLARRALESRLRRQASQIVRGLRTRLESGDPQSNRYTGK
jgi:hypothetical protein